MEWLEALFSVETLSLLIPIVVLVGTFIVATLKAHHRHLERIEKIKHGFDPDLK
ncbi:MAG: hypothetical protein JKX78_11055 [Alteromonadaceae bacterium]|nr:hypothetical protein [Alteromonadaceae bacterium]